MDDIFIITSDSVSYRVIAYELGRELAKRFNVRILQCRYQGEYHKEPFGVIPTHYRYLPAHVTYLQDVIKTESNIFIFDLRQQIRLEEAMQDRDWEYVGIFPIESGPLLPDWAEKAKGIDQRFVISKFGVRVCEEAGLDVTYLPLGIDTHFWSPGYKEEARQTCIEFWLKTEGVVPQDYMTTLSRLVHSRMILTVADNQERKNLPACFEILMQLEDKNAILVIVAPSQPHGWDLHELAERFGCSDRFVWVGNLPKELLREHYRAADVFLLPSQAEGHGLILREAAACGIPWVATDCTAISEAEGGYLIPPNGEWIFPVGNMVRYWIDVEKATQAIERIFNGELPDAPVEWPTWGKCADVLLTT